MGEQASDRKEPAEPCEANDFIPRLFFCTSCPFCRPPNYPIFAHRIKLFTTIGQENLVFIVLDEDPITHTDEHPFCSDDPECPCREDSMLVRMFITKPLDNGLITNAEAIRLYFGTQLVPSQDERITDEDIERGR